MSRGICIIEDEPQGYFDGKPYEILEFDVQKQYYKNLECNVFEICSLSNITAIDKWVWFILNSSTNGEYDGTWNMLLMHVTPAEIADLLGFEVHEVEESMENLINLGLLKRYEIDGKSHIYAAVSGNK